MGASDLDDPILQLGAGCLVDQLVGQYMAHVLGLGYLHKKRSYSLANFATFLFSISLKPRVSPGSDESILLDLFLEVQLQAPQVQLWKNGGQAPVTGEPR